MDKQWKYTLKASLIIFACYILASGITFGVVAIMNACGVRLDRGGLLLLVLIILASCTVIASIITALYLKYETKIMNRVKESLDRIANGDFTAKLDINVRSPLMKRIMQNIDTVIGELGSVAILKNDFVRKFSHEFKTPIVSIKGFSELLCKDKTLTDEEKEKYYNIIREESERLANLANMTLLLSKLDSQNIVVDKEYLYIDEQIEECAMQLAPEVENKNIDVSIELPHIQCNASKELLKELWLNLFSNAVKYTPENGRIEIFSHKTDNGYEICFKDNGIGISETAQKHIFDEYYQVDGKSNGGIGLGLSIVKHVVDLHGWKISVDSAVGSGTTFTVGIE